MDLTALLLSRVQFAFTISFHIIFPSFRIGALPHSSLAFMFWGAGVFVFPLTLLYTVISYTVFKGKVGTTSHD